MNIHISHRNQTKIGLILLFTIITILTLITYGHHDPFFPWNISAFIDLIYFGTGGSASSIGHQSFCAIMCLVFGCNPDMLLIVPVFLIPLFLTAYILFYKISRRPILSALLVITTLGYVASSSVFVPWIHGHGLYLFYVLLLILVLYLTNGDITRSAKIGFILCTVIVIVATNYGSYNYMANMAMLVVYIACGMIVMWIRTKICKLNTKQSCPIVPFVILSGLAFALVFVFNSFYKTFISFVKNMLYGSGVSGVEKLAMSSSLEVDSGVSVVIEPITSTVQEMVTTVTNNILSASVLFPYYVSIDSPSIFGWIRSVLICVVIALYGIWLLKQYLGKKYIHPLNILFSALVLMTLSYAFIRTFFVGKFSMGQLILVGCLILLWLMQTNATLWKIDLKRLSHIVCICFIVLGLILISTNTIPKMIDDPRFIDAQIQTESMGEWSYQYSVNPVATDIYTKGMMEISVISEHNPIKSSSVVSRYAVFAEEGRAEILSLLNPGLPGGDRDVVLNYPLKYIDTSTTDWVALHPWSKYANVIPWSIGYNFVCSIGEIDYLTPYIQ